MNNDITYKLNYKVYSTPVSLKGYTKKNDELSFFFNLVRAWNEN